MTAYTLRKPVAVKFRSSAGERVETVSMVEFGDPNDQVAADMLVVDRAGGETAAKIAFIAHICGQGEPVVRKLHPVDLDTLYDLLTAYDLPPAPEIETHEDGGFIFALRKPARLPAVGDQAETVVSTLRFPNPDDRTAEDMLATDGVSGVLGKTIALIAHLSKQEVAVIQRIHPEDLNALIERLTVFTLPGLATGTTGSET